MLRAKSIASLILIHTTLLATSNAFAPSQSPAFVSTVTQSSTKLFAKGFGAKEEKPKKSEGQIKREGERSRYDEISSQGGQEYSIFVRQFGGEDASWLPCGSIAVPRGAQVSDAVYANDEDLKKAIVRTYPKLKGFEDEFEFGYNLKVYPDDPIEVAVKGTPRAAGLSFGNWISTLFSPVDASGVKNPPTN